MPRNGQGVYSLPPVYQAVTGETIQAQQHNVPLEDMAKDMNDPRPISTGGTGGGSAAQARAPENLDVYSRSEADAATINVLKNAATKAVPVDADGVIVSDSEDAGKSKRVLWSVIKDRLKAFFDPIYQPKVDNIQVLELNSATTVDANVFIDFHATAGVDFNARLIRNGGTNGAFQINQIGTGNIDLIANKTTVSGNFTAGGEIVSLSGDLSTQAGNSSGNAQYWYRNVDSAVRAVTYASPSGDFTIGVAGNTKAFSFAASGVLTTPSDLKVGVTGGGLLTDGNPTGSRWQTWGSIYAFNAIDLQIESRAAAYANAGRDTAIANIIPTIAAQGVGAVGTYAMLKAIAGTSPEAGTLKPGSELQYSNAFGNGAVSPSGTWMSCGRSLVTTTDSSGAVTLYLKKAA